MCTLYRICQARPGPRQVIFYVHCAALSWELHIAETRPNSVKEATRSIDLHNATVSAKPIEGHEHGMEELSKNTCPSRPTEGQEQPLEDTATKASVPQTFKGRTEPTSIEDKAKVYVKRKKEEQLQVVRNSLGEMSLTYGAINAANRRKIAART